MGSSLHYLTTRWHQARSLFRMTPFDTQTVAGRSAERYRRLLHTAIARVFERVCTTVALTLSIRFAISELGEERAGVWMVIAQLAGLLSFADFGMGNGLTGLLTRAHGADDKQGAAEATSSAAFMLLLVASSLALFIGLFFPVIPWFRILGGESAAYASDVSRSVALFLGCFLLAMPLGVVTRVQFAFQEGAANSLYNSTAALLGLVLCWFMLKMGFGVPGLVAATSGAPLLVAVVASIHVFCFRYPYLRPRWSHLSSVVAKKLFRNGSAFFVMQICGAVGIFSDNFVISAILGASHVPSYSIPRVLFSIPTLFAVLILSGLWPAYGEAMARGDIAWIKLSLRRSLTATLFVTIPTAATMVFLHPVLITFWIGKPMEVPMSLIIGLAIWSVMGTLGQVVGLLLNGIHAIRFQVISGVIGAIANISLSVVLTKQIGVAGPIWGTVVSYSLCTALPLLYYLPRLLRRLSDVGPTGST